MIPTRQARPIGVRVAQCALAVALAFGAAAAFAQGVYKHVDEAGRISYTDSREAPITSHELEPLPVVAPPPVSGIRGRSRASSMQSSLVNRKEAQRRLLQAQRALARGPDMQQGIPPGVELVPGDRRRARLVALHRGVQAAEARCREVNAPDYSAEQEVHALPRVVPMTLTHNDSDRTQ